MEETEVFMLICCRPVAIKCKKKKKKKLTVGDDESAYGVLCLVWTLFHATNVYSPSS